MTGKVLDDAAKILRMIYADPQMEEYVDKTMAVLEERAEEERLIASAERKNWPAGGPHLLPPPCSPLQSKVFAIWHMLHEGLLADEGALRALSRVVEDEMPRTEHALHCYLCRRDHGRVRVHEGAVVEVVCTGCIREGRG